MSGQHVVVGLAVAAMLVMLRALILVKPHQLDPEWEPSPMPWAVGAVLLFAGTLLASMWVGATG